MSFAKEGKSMRLQTWAGALALAAAAIFAACATSSPEGQRTQVMIDVVNDFVPGSPFTVYLVPEAGIERMLGNMTPSSRQQFRYQGLAPVGEYRLVARNNTGGRIVSQTVVLDGVNGLEWRLANNLVRVTSTREPMQ
jgi:hypothetical protein